MIHESPEYTDPQRQTVDRWLPGAVRREEWGVTVSRCGGSLQVMNCSGIKVAQFREYIKNPELYTLKG